MAKVTENTWVEDPETGAPKFLAAGADVPSWAAGQVGDHLVDGDGDGAGDEPTPYADQTVADLEKAILVRNEGRTGDAIIDPEGTGRNGAVVKADLVRALEDDDAKAAAVEAESGSGGSGGDATAPGDGNGGPQE